MRSVGAHRQRQDGQCRTESKDREIEIQPKDKQARSMTSAFDIGGTEFPYTLPAYSFTVIRIHENKGK